MISTISTWKWVAFVPELYIWNEKWEASMAMDTGPLAAIAFMRSVSLPGLTSTKPLQLPPLLSALYLQTPSYRTRRAGVKETYWASGIVKRFIVYSLWRCRDSWIRYQFHRWIWRIWKHNPWAHHCIRCFACCSRPNSVHSGRPIDQFYGSFVLPKHRPTP